MRVIIISCVAHSFLSFTGQCPALAPIPNGAITYDLDTNADFDVDTVAFHSCNTGFLLFGSYTRVCLDTGRWSLLIPVCKCSLTLIIELT